MQHYKAKKVSHVPTFHPKTPYVKCLSEFLLQGIQESGRLFLAHAGQTTIAATIAMTVAAIF